MQNVIEEKEKQKGSILLRIITVLSRKTVYNANRLMSLKAFRLHLLELYAVLFCNIFSQDQIGVVHNC